ncbi:MAG: thioredoxin, partial [candidate division NC10 bacterium]
MGPDEFEVWFDKGVTDGLPVVPPTPERVERMLAATWRERDELTGLVPPNYGRATVKKIAVNAVMAGCRPDYLPVVLAAVEAACDPTFNLHGLQATTHFAAPLIVVN